MALAHEQPLAELITRQLRIREQQVERASGKTGLLRRARGHGHAERSFHDIQQQAPSLLGARCVPRWKPLEALIDDRVAKRVQVGELGGLFESN